MTLTNWLRSRPAKATPKPAPRTRLGVQQLEARDVPAVGLASALGAGNDTGSTGARDVATDAAGNTYMVGGFSGTVDFEPADSADPADTLTSRGTSDAFVAKYAPDGGLMWARRMGGDYVAPNTLTVTDVARSVTVDAAGNVYVTGGFKGAADFGSASLTSAGGYDGFVAKLGPAGDVLWARRWGTSADYSFGDQGYGVGVDRAGNVYAVGYRIVEQYVRSAGYDVLKFDAAGAPVWSRWVNTQAGAPVVDLAVDPAGNAFVVGAFRGTVDFDPGPKYLYQTAQSTDGFVLKLTPTGALGWVSPFVGQRTDTEPGYSFAGSVAVDGVGGVYVGGDYGGPVDFQPGTGATTLPAGGGGFVVKLMDAAKSPTLAWARALEESGNADISVYGLAVDASGSVYAIGTFTQVFTPGGGLPTVTSNGGSDVFVTKLSPSGAIDWAVTFGGTSNDYGLGIAVGASGTVYCAGSFGGTVDFDPDPNSTYYLTNPAYADMFLLKLRQN